MEQALKSTDLSAFRTVEIKKAHRVGGGASGRNRGGTDENYIELEAPDAGPAFGQVLLYQDEAGVLNVAHRGGDQTRCGTSWRPSQVPRLGRGGRDGG